MSLAWITEAYFASWIVSLNWKAYHSGYFAIHVCPTSIESIFDCLNKKYFHVEPYNIIKIGNKYVAYINSWHRHPPQKKTTKFQKYFEYYFDFDLEVID